MAGGSALVPMLVLVVVLAVGAQAVSVSTLLSPSFYQVSPSSIFQSPVHGQVQGDYWSTKDLLTPASSRDARSPVTIPTSHFDLTSTSDVQNSNDTAGLIAAIVLSSVGGIIILLLFVAFVFYCVRSSTWGKYMRGYDKHTNDPEEAIQEELDQYDALADI